jgi:hypothetical protein
VTKSIQTLCHCIIILFLIYLLCCFIYVCIIVCFWSDDYLETEPLESRLQDQEFEDLEQENQISVLDAFCDLLLIYL